MKLRAIANLDAIARELRQRRGLDCGYCGTMHPVGQCRRPRNWTAEPPVRSSTAVFLADEAGALERYNRQLEWEAQQEMIRQISWEAKHNERNQD